MLEKLKQIAKGLAYGLCGGVVGLLLLALISNNSEKYGNVADWVSGIGSVIAIYFVYRQVKQQTDQHNEEKGHDFKIVIGDRRASEEISTGIIAFSAEAEIVFFGTNSGMMPSSFKYIGICNSEDYHMLKTNHEKSNIDHKHYDDPEVNAFDFTYISGDKKQKFERVIPGDVSEEITLPLETIQSNFRGKCDDLYLVYMDVLGVVYGRPFGVPELDSND